MRLFILAKAGRNCFFWWWRFTSSGFRLSVAKLSHNSRNFSGDGVTFWDSVLFLLPSGAAKHVSSSFFSLLLCQL